MSAVFDARALRLLFELGLKSRLCFGFTLVHL
jgi:hypothetical protein